MNKLRHSLLKRLHWLFLLLTIADVCWALWGMAIILLATGPHSDAIRGALVIWALLLLPVAAAVLNAVAYFQTRRLRAYWFLVVVAVIDLAPYVHFLCITGIPVGIIALIALANAPVRGVFVTVASGVPRDAALAQLVQPPRFTAADEMDTANDDWDQAAR